MTVTENDKTLLSIALDLATQAADLIEIIRLRGFKTQMKHDQTPITEADNAAEKLILSGLRDKTPLIPAIGEEEVATGVRINIDKEFWLVDPLDGTREFTRGSKNFTVNIGLIRNGKPILGVVALPAWKQIYTGCGVGTALCYDRNGSRPIHVRSSPIIGLHVVVSCYFSQDPNLKACLEHLPVHRVTNIGSAVKFIRIAQGEADFFPRLNPTMEWDTAAPQAVVEAAGGHVYTLGHVPLTYQKKDFVNPPFYCTGPFLPPDFKTFVPKNLYNNR